MKIISQPWFVLVCCMVFHISCSIRLCIGRNNLTIGQSISGNQTLISQNGMFELGFFTPNKTSNKSYLGIWYKHASTRIVIWVANKQDGATSIKTSKFVLSEDVSIIIQDQSSVYWNHSRSNCHNNCSYRDVVLENDGNLVLDSGCWQSFDDPSDTWLPGVKLGMTNYGINQAGHYLNSWKSAADPDFGSFRLIEDAQYNLLLTNHQTGDSKKVLDSSLILPDNSLSKYIAFHFVLKNTSSDAYFTYSVHNTSIPTRIVLDFVGRLQLFMWMEDIGKWDLVFQHSELRSLNGSGRKKWILMIYMVIGTITLFSILLVSIWKCRVMRKSNVVVGEGSLLLLKYSDLKRWTMNFSMELGRGGFGSVYRGTMSDSTPVAVKKLECFAGEKQFRSEVNTIGLIQHVNLIRLLGFCAEGSRRLLVYEYMPNGSLSSCLFGRDSTVLDWNMRYQIALGVARGLQYLHEKCRDCIIHCDIKPENILLDVGIGAKVADFGMAKLYGRDFSRVLTTMRGTRGYLAPEWISGVPITPKADVYSYGMMLFEIISGRRNLDMVDDDMVDYFPARASEMTNKGGELLCILDQRLDGNANVQELTTACRVACWCIQDDEKERPSMGHVVSVLEGLSEVGTSPIPSFLQVILHGSEGTQKFHTSRCLDTE